MMLLVCFYIVKHKKCSRIKCVIPRVIADVMIQFRFLKLKPKYHVLIVVSDRLTSGIVILQQLLSQ